MASLPPAGPPNTPPRWCAANFALPLSREEEEEATSLVNLVHRVNCVERRPPLAGIEYRGGIRNNSDMASSVFRWDSRPFQEIFENGFRTNPAQGNSTAFNLSEFVNAAGAPLGTDRRRNFGFVSTTLSATWFPNPNTATLPPGREIQAYRYEIYAPGGVWVAPTLRQEYGRRHRRQEEVSFVGGIAPQYIRSAQLFYLSRRRQGDSATMRRSPDNTLWLNENFNPLVRVQHLPVRYYEDDRGVSRPLKIRFYRPTSERKQEIVLQQSDEDQWLVSSYIDGAFRSSRSNEAYLFFKNKYVLVNYAPGSTNDRIVNGPLLICDGYPSLMDTPFGEHGIDCAFESGIKNEAYIFCKNLCAYIDYAPGTKNDKILRGPMTITEMFPFFKNTVFEDGVDAAFRETSLNQQACLFRGNRCARIMFNGPRLIGTMDIVNVFPTLNGTVFQSGIDAAFAAHATGEAYIFRGEFYALIKYESRTNTYYDISGVKRILDHWPSLRGVVPTDNFRTDYHRHQGEARNPNEHDEL